MFTKQIPFKTEMPNVNYRNTLGAAVVQGLHTSTYIKERSNLPTIYSQGIHLSFWRGETKIEIRS